MSLLFYWFTFVINLWHRRLVVRADVTAVFVNNQHGIQRRGQDFDKSLYLNGYTANRLADEFPQKSWTKFGVNKQLKKLRDIGTVDRWPGSGRPCCVRTEDKNSSGDEIANVNFFLQHRTCRGQRLRPLNEFVIIRYLPTHQTDC